MSLDLPAPLGANPLPAPERAAAVLRAYVLTATQDRLGRDLSPAARFAAMDACDAIDRLVSEVCR